MRVVTIAIATLLPFLSPTLFFIQTSFISVRCTNDQLICSQINTAMNPSVLTLLKYTLMNVTVHIIQCQIEHIVKVTKNLITFGTISII